MKSEFNARPVYLSRKDRIKAHFTVCFLALVIYRYLEKKLDEKYTTSEIIETLRNLNLREIPGYGYLPTYKYTDINNNLDLKFNWDFKKEFIDVKKIKKIINCSKK